MGHISMQKAYSRHLARNGGCRLILPEREQRGLILFHGAQESPETMLENCDIAALADELGLAVLLPELDNSFCLDWGPGMEYRSWLLEELLPHVRAEHPVFETCALGGISMGGFAAVSLALSRSEEFPAAFSLSGALDPKKAAQLCRIIQAEAPTGLREMGDRPGGRVEELLEALAEVGGPKPRLYLAWGEDDWFVKCNEGFAEKAAGLGFAPETHPSPGLHDWDYWRRALPPALRWAASV